MEKIASDGPKWDPRGFFPTIPDLADILGRADLDFDNFYFYLFYFLDPEFLDFQVSRFPNSQIEAWADFDLLEHSSAVAPRWLPDHKVWEIQGTRTIP